MRFANRDNEIWLDIPHYLHPSNTSTEYQASSHGRIRNKQTMHILAQHKNRDGYMHVCLGHRGDRSVHRLVLETFAGPSPQQNYQVNHIDCNRQNNFICNLEWCSPRDNVMWAMQKGNCDPLKGLMVAREVNKKPVRIVETGEIFDSLKQCAEHLGVTRGNVSRCLSGERKGQKIHGIHVEYVNGEEVYYDGFAY